MKGYRLMIPGPVDVVPEVLQPMCEEVEPHFGPEWTEYYNQTLGLLKKIFRTQGDVFVIPGTGSAAVEACVSTAIGGGGRLLLPNNGYFGDRMETIARSHSDNVETLKYKVGEPLDLDQIETALSTGRHDVLAVTHCETSIGILNPVKEIGEICRRHGVRLMVDAVSSLGVERLEMDAWGIDLCATASQKGLETPPGLGLAVVSPGAWDFLNRHERPGWYLNLNLWRKYAREWRTGTLIRSPWPSTTLNRCGRGLKKSWPKGWRRGRKDIGAYACICAKNWKASGSSPAYRNNTPRQG